MPEEAGAVRSPCAGGQGSRRTAGSVGGEGGALRVPSLPRRRRHRMPANEVKTMSPARILIVWDDDEDEINIFTQVFERAGYMVQSVRTCDEGIAACLRQPPDILIVPRVIEHQNKGIEFCQRVRAISNLPRFPIIVGYADIGHSKWQEAYQQAYDAGANACFGRVFDITDVLEEITLLLANPTITNVVDRQTLQLSQRATHAKAGFIKKQNCA